MAQIDSYLKRLVSSNELSCQEDFLELYSFVPNEDLQTLLAIYHTQLNQWFTIINRDLHIEFDEDGNQIYKGGYFHAQDSRDLLSVMDTVDQLQTKCRATAYAFSFCNGYDDVVKRCKKFITKSGGSTIPEGFASIEIIELLPVFQFVNGVSIEQDIKSIYSNLKTVGDGSYAHVFSYIDPFYSVPIILKRARHELDSKELERFEQEYNVLKSLHSPYIVEVYAYNKAKHEYTMEYMDESIYKYVKRNNGQLSIQSRKRIIAQICRGLSYIHSKGLLHRDISLTNVFVKHYDDVDVVKIGDFGLVKIPESSLTSVQSELKGSLNDPDLIHVGFGKYEMCHETFALTRLCYFILTGKTNIERQKDGTIKRFWDKGTSPNKIDRFTSADELLKYVMSITDENK